MPEPVPPEDQGGDPACWADLFEDADEPEVTGDDPVDAPPETGDS